jgi:broad specificity phosphatase PhoE
LGAEHPPGAELWLVRHGETAWSRDGRHTGRTDVPLTEAGERRARELRATLAGRRFAAVYTSPMLRARRTAELAGFGDAVVTPLLREYDYGEYEGLTTAEIERARTGWELFHDGCPGGETPAQVYERARRFCELAAAAPGDVLAFCHGHVSRAIAVAFLRWPVELAADFASLDAGRFGVLLSGGRGNLLRAWNGRG